LTRSNSDFQNWLKTINSSRLTVDPEGNLWFSNVTRKDASEDFLYACSAASYFRNEYKLGNRVHMQVRISSPAKEVFLVALFFMIINHIQENISAIFLKMIHF
jgi:hypothetical protein